MYMLLEFNSVQANVWRPSGRNIRGVLRSFDVPNGNPHLWVVHDFFSLVTGAHHRPLLLHFNFRCRYSTQSCLTEPGLRPAFMFPTDSGC